MCALEIMTGLPALTHSLLLLLLRLLLAVGLTSALATTTSKSVRDAPDTSVRIMSCSQPAGDEQPSKEQFVISTSDGRIDGMDGSWSLNDRYVTKMLSACST